MLTLFALLYYKAQLNRRLTQINHELNREMGDRIKAQEQHAISEARYRDISISMADWIWEVDAQGIYTFVDSNVTNLLGYEPHELLGKSPFEFMPADEAKRVGARFAEIIGNMAPIEDLENWNYTRNGHLVCLLTNGVPIIDAQGNLLGYRGVDKDITEKKLANDQLQRFKKIIDSANEAIVVTDLGGVIVDINPAYERITGYTRDEIIGATPAKLKSDRHDKAFYQAMWQAIGTDGCWEGEVWDRRKNGEVFPKWLSINALYNTQGQATHYVGTFSDISEKKKAEENLLNLAYYDPLTHLPNRSHFRERLMHDLATAARRGDKLALLFIDLDRFKYVNDTYGHAAGDRLLSIVAERLKQRLREEDTIARLGGDEFTVILTGLKTTDSVPLTAQQIVDILYEPITLHDQEVRVGGSVGIAVYPDDGSDYETLSKKADMAMYQAKAEGRNTYQFFSSDINRYITERLSLEADLHKALENQQFEVHYQPKYHVNEQRISGVEALLRWRHPQRGNISPADFIPIAEDSGLIVPIGLQVLEQACTQMARWQHDYGRDISVAVNLSARQFQQKNLVNDIEAVLHRTGLSPHLLELEITESTLMESIDRAVATMERLRALGLSLAIDDFGTGYSSLNYLKRFPINTLKIDKSFIRDLTSDSNDAAIVRAIIALARTMDLKVVAEGVETQEQLNYLSAHGCNQLQGFLLSHPLSAGDLEQTLQQAISA